MKYFCVPLAILMAVVCVSCKFPMDLNRDTPGVNKEYFLTPSEICALPEMWDGSSIECMKASIKWYHNIKSGKCEEFIFGGCLGNENNFDTKKECEDFCVKKPESKKETTEKTKALDAEHSSQNE